jgi:hypothetical protein
MSLQHIADHLAAQGRNGDSTLVHMTPSEVVHLQKLAESQGKTLTINPETGLPEAFELESLLPMAAGAAISYFSGGTIDPMTAAAMVGGGTAIATGDVNKGLMAGMGAYGGAGMSAGLMGMGEGALGNAAVDAATAGAAEQGLTGAARDEFMQQQVAEKMAGTSTFDKLSSGFGQATSKGGLGALSDQMSASSGPSLGRAAGAVAIPALLSSMTATKMPDTGKAAAPGFIRPYRYVGDPRAQRIEAATPVLAGEVGSRSLDEMRYAADGGMMMDNTNPYNLQYRNEPVVRMADGGTAHFDEGGHTSYTPEQINNYFAQNPNADVGAAIKEYNADPAAVLAQRASANATPNTVTDLYSTVLGRAPDAGGANYWQQQFGDTVDANEMDIFRNSAAPELAARNAAQAASAAPMYNEASTQQIRNYINDNKLDQSGIDAATKQFNVNPMAVTAAQNAQDTVATIYRNVLGRDPDPAGMSYWTDLITSGKSTPDEMYSNFLKGAGENKELMNTGLSLTQAQSPYKGYESADKLGIADEWVRNVLGREVTADDRKQQWYKDASSGATMNSYDAAQNIYKGFQSYAKEVGATTTRDRATVARQIIAGKGLTDADVLAQTGKTVEQLIGNPKTDLDIFRASQLLAPSNSAFDFQSLKNKEKTTPQTNAPAGTTNLYGNPTNPGDVTKNPDGSTTVTPNIPGRPYGGFSGMGEVKNAYTQGGGSLGYTPYAPKTAAEQDAMYNKMTGGSKSAYDYLMGKADYSPVPYTKTGEVSKAYNTSTLGFDEDKTTMPMIWDSKARKYVANPAYKKPITAVEKAAADKAAADKAAAAVVPVDSGGNFATGGLMALAAGGGAQYNLGSYSDGGRLLRGPGDGVSDSIPATIGKGRPARLADGEFVVPARIVSELGNGSTEAGAKQLYAMMDRVQKARGKTVGKGKVAANSRASKHLPA